ncbi:uncharacterized membrane protein HdeD (DUF308 family) [Nocardia sp. GAS34]|uniref:hypothetical protein n=1 Tax=unclassified Nocardia TaxID=2637762 RepID=UPI003D2535C6
MNADGSGLVLLIVMVMCLAGVSLIAIGVIWTVTALRNRRNQSRPPAGEVSVTVRDGTSESERPHAQHAPADASMHQLNPYATIALVSGLLGLFWVAIIYGLLAFRRPGGRGQARAGLICGLLELVGVAVALGAFAAALHGSP